MSFSSRQESSRSWDESSDPESIGSIQKTASISRNNNNIVISNLTGNLVSDSVVVNIEDDSDDSTTSNESNSDADIDDDDDDEEAICEEDDILHHNDWEVRMLAAELKKRESVSEPSQATTALSGENDGLLRRRKRRSDTDTDVSENETTRSRPRAASLDQHNLRKQQLKNRGVFKAMSFDRDKDQL